MARQKTADNNDLLDLIDQSGGEAKGASSADQAQDEPKVEKLCRNAIRKLSSSNTIWMILIPVSLVLAGVIIFLAGKGPGKFLIKTWEAQQWIAALSAIACIALSISRITSNGNSLKTFKEVKQYLSDGLPEQSDILIRETYFYYCKRRCVHFWLSFGFGALFVLCILYSILAAFIDMAANLSWVPDNVKIHEWTVWRRPKEWTAGHKFITFGFFGIIINLIQFVVCKSSYKPFIEALEDKYGKDQIIDECLYCHRMFKVNFKYKSFAFMIIAFLGCFFYLFTKRFICTMFDKSCTY